MLVPLYVRHEECGGSWRTFIERAPEHTAGMLRKWQKQRKLGESKSYVLNMCLAKGIKMRTCVKVKLELRNGSSLQLII